MADILASLGSAVAEVLKKVLDNLRDRKGTLLIAYFALLLALFAAATIFGGRIGAVLILSGLLPAIVFLAVEITPKRRRAVAVASTGKKRPLWVERIIVASATLAFIAFGYASHRAEVLGAVFPGLYPTTAGRLLLTEHHQALNAILSAQSPDEQLTAFRRWLETQTVERRNRKVLIPFAKQAKLIAPEIKALPSVLDPQISADEEKMKKIAVAFRAAYKGSAALHLLSLTPLGKSSTSSDSEEWLYFVQLEGRYLIDRFFEDSSLADVSQAILAPNSPEGQELRRRFQLYYPDADLDLFTKALPQQKVSSIRNRNALEVLAFQTGAAMEIDPNTQLFGYEILSGKIVLQRQPGRTGFWARLTDNPWRIAEIAPYSIFRTQKGTPPPPDSMARDSWTRLQTEIPYVAQEDETLCQSAALQMALSTLDSSFSLTQREIRDELAKLKGGALSHEARKEFAVKYQPKYRWKSRYERTLENVVRDIRAQLKLGVPVMFSTRFTPPGHVIVVTGIGRDPSGRWLVEAHDPAGSFDFYRRRFSGNGLGVRYDLSKLSVKTQQWVNGAERQLAFYVVGEECWSPSLRSLWEKGFQPAAEASMDWEWLAATEEPTTTNAAPPPVPSVASKN